MVILKQENELYSRDSQRLDPHRRLYSKKFLAKLQQQQQQDTSESASSRTRKPVRKVEREQKEDQGSRKEDPELSRIRKLYAQDESTVEKEPEFKVDLRMERIAHDVIWKDEERKGKIQEVVGN